MPWEKSFDPADAIEKAMQVFWSKGYARTSIADLTEATGVQRGSLYNAFKNKDELFVKALLKYELEHRRQTLADLESRLGPREAILALFAGSIDQSCQDPLKRGCLLVNTALDLTSQTAEVQAIVTAGLRDIEAFFQRMIERAQARGEVPDTVDAVARARALVSLIVGLRVLARGAWEDEALASITREVEHLLT